MSFNQTNNAVLQEKKLTFTIRLVAGIYQRMNGNRKTDKRFEVYKLLEPQAAISVLGLYRNEKN